jgi:hypothetical protein
MLELLQGFLLSSLSLCSNTLFSDKSAFSRLEILLGMPQRGRQQTTAPHNLKS